MLIIDQERTHAMFLSDQLLIKQPKDSPKWDWSGYWLIYNQNTHNGWPLMIGICRKRRSSGFRVLGKRELFMGSWKVLPPRTTSFPLCSILRNWWNAFNTVLQFFILLVLQSNVTERRSLILWGKEFQIPVTLFQLRCQQGIPSDE